jgi:hypothetical protein
VIVTDVSEEPVAYIYLQDGRTWFLQNFGIISKLRTSERVGIFVTLLTYLRQVLIFNLSRNISSSR